MELQAECAADSARDGVSMILPTIYKLRSAQVQPTACLTLHHSGIELWVCLDVNCKSRYYLENYYQA